MQEERKGPSHCRDNETDQKITRQRILLPAIPWPIIVVVVPVIVSPVAAVPPDFPLFTGNGCTVASNFVSVGAATKIVTQFLSRVSEFSAISRKLAAVIVPCRCCWRGEGK